jgi:hypothetical protein
VSIRSSRLWAIVAIAGLAPLSFGCSDQNLGEVEGTVRFNGQPLGDATVTFTPCEPKGSASIGRTDANGRYELYYAGKARGAEIGEHIVRVTTFQRGDPDAATPMPPCHEKVPVEFNERTKLTKTIQPGKNLIDIELEGVERR